MAYGVARDENAWEDSFFEEPIRSESIGNLAAVPAARPEPVPQRPETLPQAEPERRRRVRRVPDPARQKSKRAFVLFSAMLLCGALCIVGMYAKVYSQRGQVSRLEARLEQEQKETMMVQQEEAEALSMTDLYTYATEELGMVAADGKMIIRITLVPQDYTTEMVTDKTGETRVSFHWFG